MLKKDFAKLYAEMNNMSNENSIQEIERFLETMKTALSQDQTIVFRGFGSFEVKKTKERMIVDPKIQNEKKYLHAKPRKYVKFKVSRTLEDKLTDI